MTKTETIEKVIRGSIKQLNAGRVSDQRVSADQSTFLSTPLGPLTHCPLLSSWNPGHRFLYHQGGNHPSV